MTTNLLYIYSYVGIKPGFTNGIISSFGTDVEIPAHRGEKFTDYKGRQVHWFPSLKIVTFWKKNFAYNYALGQIIKLT